MLSTTPIYIIWYGTWTSSQQVIVRDFFNTVTNSDWLKIQTTYYQALSSPNSKTFVSASVKLTGETIDSYSQGHSINDIDPVVKYAFDNNRLPVDANGIYFVAVSADVNFAGFCSVFCGYHSAFTYSGKTIRNSMVGNNLCCAGNNPVSPFSKCVLS